ncbi:helix-turn-helix transcriptional regulator [Kineosporia sp. J2-2]|uniref:Helix-turn-helix transcriptional regulator n=1 Tax=Kineosporia corallincola TaxID=2835133 RepID=A0ABS5TL74_9ACTN|nr:helix-turn-helix transcriptional regulator [Kineosporia corallincola]MBT0771760.1 helix-turn-helix transcriptional regulator [Kineosporia corallincola]
MTSTSGRLAIRRAFRAWRAARGLSQDEVAAMVDGWDQRQVSRVEAGERSIKLEEAAEICRALGVPLRRLLIELDPDDREAIGLPRHEDESL